MINSIVHDRNHLGVSIKEYDLMSRAVSSQSYLNRKEEIIKIKTTTSKKLKNLKREIHKNSFLMESMIWREQLRIIEAELKRRRKWKNQ